TLSAVQYGAHDEARLFSLEYPATAKIPKLAAAAAATPPKTKGTTDERAGAACSGWAGASGWAGEAGGGGGLACGAKSTESRRLFSPSWRTSCCSFTCPLLFASKRSV